MLGWLWTHLRPHSRSRVPHEPVFGLWGGIAVALFCLLVIRLFVLRALPAASRAADLTGFAKPVRSRRAAPLASSPSAPPSSSPSRPTFWSQAVIAEVYTLHAAFVAALLLALLLWAERTCEGDVPAARRRSYLVALLFGLSLAHHRSTILLIPAAALFVAIVLLGTRTRPRFSRRQAAVLLACLLAPLLLYLYIPLAAPACAVLPARPVARPRPAAVRFHPRRFSRPRQRQRLQLLAGRSPARARLTSVSLRAALPLSFRPTACCSARSAW